MRPLLEDRRIRTLIIAVLAVVVVLGLLNIVSTAFSLLVPLAIAGAVAFAFYKIALEGRDSSAVTQDEIADSLGEAGANQAGAAEREAKREPEADEAEARSRLSAVERARGDFFDAASPAEEILDQIKSRKRRLSGDDS